MLPSPTAVIRCDASPSLGLGHVVRCLALADELRRAGGCTVTFAMREEPLGLSLVRDRGYLVAVAPSDLAGAAQGAWLSRVLDQTGARILVLDVRDDLSRQAVEALRRPGLVIAVVDDLSERRLAADLVFYPPVPQVERLSWAGFGGRCYHGWEWVILRPEFACPPARVAHARPLLLVTMGGSDPAGMTLRAVQALDGLDGDFEAILVLGPGFCHDRELGEVLAGARRHYHLRRSVADMPALMAQADLAIASFGVTAYELAAMGVPAIYLCLTEDHAESATAFVAAGIAESLGVHQRVSPAALAAAVGRLLKDQARRERMATAGRRLVDGRGSARIAHVLCLAAAPSLA